MQLVRLARGLHTTNTRFITSKYQWYMIGQEVQVQKILEISNLVRNWKIDFRLEKTRSRLNLWL